MKHLRLKRKIYSSGSVKGDSGSKRRRQQQPHARKCNLRLVKQFVEHTFGTLHYSRIPETISTAVSIDVPVPGSISKTLSTAVSMEVPLPGKAEPPFLHGARRNNKRASGDWAGGVGGPKAHLALCAASQNDINLPRPGPKHQERNSLACAPESVRRKILEGCCVPGPGACVLFASTSALLKCFPFAE